MKLNEIITDFMLHFYLNKNNAEKILLFEQRNMNIIKKDVDYEGLVSNLNRLYMYNFADSILLTYEGMAKYVLPKLSEDLSIDEELKCFLRGRLLSDNNNFIPTKETSKSAEEYLRVIMIYPVSLIINFKYNHYMSLLDDDKANISLHLFKYYREFTSLPEKEQKRVIDFLYLVKDKKRVLFKENGNNSAFIKYSNYSFYLFLSLYFQHIDGKDRTKELNKLLEESLTLTIEFLSEKNKKDIDLLPISPLNFFTLYERDGQTMSNIFNEIFSFARDISTQQREEKEIEELLKNKVYHIKINLNEISSSSKEFFLDMKEYIEEVSSFYQKIYKNYFDIDIDFSTIKLDEYNEIDDYYQKYLKRVEEGINKSKEYIEQIKTREDLDYILNILEKPFEELNAKEVKNVDSVFREYFLTKKENIIINNKKFPELLKKYLDFIENFSTAKHSMKEIFYKHTEVKDDNTRKIVDKFFDNPEIILDNIEIIKDISEDIYSYSSYYEESKKKEIKRILNAIGIKESCDGNNFQILFKAINYVLWLDKIENPLIIKLYLEKEASRINFNILSKNWIKEIIENELYKEMRRAREKENRKYNDFSINVFLVNLLDNLDLGNKINNVMLNKIFEEKNLFRGFFVAKESIYPFLKTKMIYEYSKEKGFSVEEIIKNEEKPILEYLNFAENFSKGKLKEAKESFKNIEKYTEHFMKILENNPETFFFFRNFILDKIGYYYYDEYKKELLEFDKVRKETVKQSGIFKKNLEKVLEDNKESLFWNFLADTAFFSAVPLFTLKSGIKKHYENIDAISELLSPYKIYNADNNFIQKHYSYFISLSKIARGTLLNKKILNYDISTSLSNNTDFLKKHESEVFKYFFHLMTSQYVPITYSEVYYIYKEKFRKVFEFNQDIKEQFILANLLLNNFKPSIAQVTDKESIKRLRVFTNENNHLFSATIGKCRYWLIGNMFIDDKNGTFYAVTVKNPSGIHINNSINNRDISTIWLDKSLTSLHKWTPKDNKKFEKILLDKINKKDYDFKNFLEFFDSSSNDNQIKKMAVNFFKKPLFFIKDKKISKDIIMRASLNKDNFINGDKYFLAIDDYYYEKISPKEIPVVIGPLEYKETPEEALQEAAGVLLVNFKSEIETVKKFIQEIKNKERKNKEITDGSPSV